MSGHSKWSSIKHQKGVADARRGQLFTKLTREIIVVVREGGSNPEANFRLRLAVQKAHDANMPLDNIERAIKRGSGDLEGVTLTEMTLEGYGPGGVAVLVQALSDNRNRTVQETRNVFSRGGGGLAESGSVTWMFASKGLITVDAETMDTDELTLKAIDAGADDVSVESACVEIYTRPEDMEKVKATLEQEDITINSAELCMSPQTTLELEEKPAIQTLKLLQKLESLDDVQNVYSNVDFSEDVLEKFQEQA
ncbi:MAG: YebC/PmpR family DNA-binding transcriptional regulator [Dehalococcoidales bacterium]|jgi:YebC/PmpR family DNA-binding regulatory protein|nr:YebC/PmpR family DNA-binding transcriptional regulator [Dehalococcoidales bacterium]MDP7525058.1 YebC/PmpR family DNA-binding transcriptional regulator [Dehalococcoidales bacterium]